MRTTALIFVMLTLLFLPASIYGGDKIYWARLTAEGLKKGMRQNGISNLLIETAKRTNIDAEPWPQGIRIDKNIFNYPFVSLLGDSNFNFTSREVESLRNYLLLGGTLFIDNSGGVKGNLFDIAVRRELGRIFPELRLEPIPPGSVLYKTFYLIKFVSGRVIAQPYLEGLSTGGRYAVIYSMNDLAGAWAKDAAGRWEFDVLPGGEAQREHAVRLGVNIIMYALTLDYKDDAVHRPFILQREKR